MEPLLHECGVAMIRLRKPLSYYNEKYGTWAYGMNKLFLLMNKQYNRGQQGAGIACVKLKASPGEDYMFRERSEGAGAISEVFAAAESNILKHPLEKKNDPEYAYKNFGFAGELYMGHLRYCATGKTGLQYVHPYLRRNNWRAKNLALCGNFHITNVDDVFQELVSHGQHPRVYADTYILLELMGHRLDREVERVFKECENEGLKGMQITKSIEDRIDIANVLKTSAPLLDGGYVLCGMTGSGEMYAMRDPWGVRTAYWYADDEIFVLASERAALQTAMNLSADKVVEMKPGEAIIMNKNGELRCEQIIPQIAFLPCSFERIYFSRGNDGDIYKERKMLGANLRDKILDAVDHDLDNTVFSFIPNTAEMAFYGMLESMEDYLNEWKCKELSSRKDITKEEMSAILAKRVRQEKVANKDIKMRTFITTGDKRNDLAGHVYDITYDTIKPKVDNLVVIDDSIVRGTTLRESILSILDRLEPKRIVVVSSSPQIRYPDYYGIDMEKFDHFVAFFAAMELLRDRGLMNIVNETYVACVEELKKPLNEMKNCTKAIYAPFTPDEISDKIAELLKPATLQAEVKLVFQSLEGLHDACPNHLGDWYFSGDYPTPGGNMLVNRAFVEHYEKYIISDDKK
ncbi:MAG: amidophosphoribosyltransferase [Bacteroidaceae bacterium]|nr:amidophosphoribosyltransferase [Bacteroidaceae bacterium]